MDDVVCENINKCCNKNVHNIIDKMLPNKLRIFLFNWDNFSENNIDGLMQFLKENFGDDGIRKEDIKIEEIYDGGTAIRVSAGKTSISFKIFDNRIIYKIKGIRRYENKLILKVENDNKKIYYKADKYKGGLFKDCEEYPIFEGLKCFQYLQEYVPLHLPQIEYVLKDVMLKYDFDDMALNIMDIGTGPATVPLAFCRLDPNEYPYTKFKITTVEASKTFNDMISVFECMNKNKSVEVDCKFNYNIADLKNSPTEYKIGYNWILFANSISAIGKSEEEAHKWLNKFISNILKRNIKLGYSNTILLTIIEGGSESYFPEKNDYLSKIESIPFDDLELKKSIQPTENSIEVRWIKKCEFFNFGKSWMYKPNIHSKSLLLELKQ